MNGPRRSLESCIRIGRPLLIEDLGEHLEPTLEPVLLKAMYRQGNRWLMQLGDRTVDYDHRFRLYMTTKLANPHYLPEVSIKVTLINFTVTMDGLQDQLLGQVLKKERPDVEQRKAELVVQMTEDKKLLVDLENKILSLLSESEGNILDDEILINTLAESKVTAVAIGERVAESERINQEINDIREQYSSVATRGAIIYFVIADLATIDPMYQYSLFYFQALFNKCIDDSEQSSHLETRLNCILTYTTRVLYVNICRGLFEKDKLLFASLMCFQIERHAGNISQDEWIQFVRNPTSSSFSAGCANAQPDAISEKGWLAIQALAPLLASHTTQKNNDFLTSFGKEWGEWKAWVQGRAPTHRTLPASLSALGLSKFMCILLVKALR